MRHSFRALLLALLLALGLTACAASAPETPVPEALPDTPETTAPEALPDTPEPSEPAYTISLAGRDDLAFGCTVWTEDAGESGAEIALTEESRAVLERLFDGQAVDAGELPANIPSIQITAGTCRILIDDTGFVSVSDGEFSGCYALSPEDFSELRALLPENAMANRP